MNSRGGGRGQCGCGCQLGHISGFVLGRGMCPATDTRASWFTAGCTELTYTEISSSFWIMILRLELELGAGEHATELRACTFRSMSNGIEQDLALLVLGRVMPQWSAAKGGGPGVDWALNVVQQPQKDQGFFLPRWSVTVTSTIVYCSMRNKYIVYTWCTK